MSLVLGSILSAVATGVVGWFIGRREIKAKAIGQELENVEKAIGIYRSVISDLSSKIKGMEAEMQHMHTRLHKAEIKLQEAEEIIEDYRKKYNN